jgi:hypothetical protein
MTMTPGFGLMLHGRACHLAAAFRAVHAGLDAFIHAADVFAILGAGVANFGADSAKAIVEHGTAQHEVSRSLTNFGAAHHHAEVFRFNVLAAHFQAEVHSRLQTNLMAFRASLDAGLHGMLRAMHGLFRAHGLFRIGLMSHEILPG